MCRDNRTYVRVSIVDETGALCGNFRREFHSRVPRLWTEAGDGRPQARGEPVDETRLGAARRRLPSGDPARRRRLAGRLVGRLVGLGSSTASSTASAPRAPRRLGRRFGRSGRLGRARPPRARRAPPRAAAPGPPARRRAQLGDDVGEDLERNRVAADPLDRVHLELAAVDADLLLLPEPVGDVRRCDRAEERAGRAGVDVEAKLGRLEPRGDRAAPRRPSSPRAGPAARRASRAP